MRTSLSCRRALLIGAVLAGSTLCADEPMPWDVPTYQTVPVSFPAPSLTDIEGVKSIYLQGPDFQGKPTKFFAFYGLPKETSGKVPGMVLVHGGKGTAYPQWVKLWNDRGYAAIAFDHFGGLPEEVEGKWKRNSEGGPDIGGAWQMAWPIKDQWMYHAVADTMLAASFLASLPEVDANRIGLTGISWGAVVSSIVAGVDSRFRFIAPVYGCGFLSERWSDGSQFVGKNDSDELRLRWRETWDPARYLARAKMPFLWVNGTNDFAFTLRSWQLSQGLPSGSRTASLHLKMEHSQGAGQAPEEIATFADSVLKEGRPLIKVGSQGRSGGRAWMDYASGVPVKEAVLMFTRQGGKWQDRVWETLPAEIDADAHRVSARVPEDAVVYAFQLTDERGLIVSGEIQPESAFSDKE